MKKLLLLLLAVIALIASASIKSPVDNATAECLVAIEEISDIQPAQITAKSAPSEAIPNTTEPPIAEETEPIEETSPSPTEDAPIGGEWVQYEVTAYCACLKCTDGDGVTASGAVATEGITIAADTSVLPFGTEVYIDGYGTYIVQDRGGAIEGNKIDLFFESHQAALNFGRRMLNVQILSYGGEANYV